MKRDCMMKIVLACIGLVPAIFVTSVSACEDPRQPYLEQAQREGKQPEEFFREMKEERPEEHKTLMTQFFDAYSPCAIEHATNVEVHGCGTDPFQEYNDVAEREGHTLQVVFVAQYFKDPEKLQRDRIAHDRYKECTFNQLIRRLFPDRLGGK